VSAEEPVASPVQWSVPAQAAVLVRTASARSRTLQYLLPGYLLIATGGLVTAMRVFRLVENLRQGVRVDQTVLEAAAGRADLVDWVSVGMFVLIGVFFLRWVHAAASAAAVLRPEPARTSPGWAVGWYFVPLFNVWKPYLAMREIEARSARDGRDKLGALLPVWWGLWLTVSVSGFVGARMFVVASEPILISAGALLGCVAEGLKLVLGWQLIRLVGRIRHLQEQAVERATG